MTLIILVSLFLLAFYLSLALGAQKLSLKDIFQNPEANFSKTIFFKIRLPRTLLVLISGALLAGAGTLFQMFFRNPLAEPGIMGITSGASLGAVIAASFGGGAFCCGLISLLNAGAFFGALLAALLVTAISFKISKSSTVALLLCGTALGSLYSAITSIMLAINDRQLNSIYFWMLGSFSGRGWNELKFIFLPSLVALFFMIISIPQLDLLSSGEATARTLGVNVNSLRIKVIVAGAFATSAAVCAGGTIGFVGLIAPHAIRQITGVKGKELLPLSMTAGSVLLLFSDTLCRLVIAPAEIPVGTVTAILGVPFFISLLLTSFNERKSTKF